MSKSIVEFPVKTFVYSDSNPYYEVHFKPGIYKIECWGASGGISTKSEDGYGAYTSGIITLRTQTKLFIVLGEQGQYSETKVVEHKETFNGGGSGGTKNHINGYGAGSGGGATDIRLEYNGDWSDFNSLKSRIMVAAGGSGITYYLGGGIHHYFGASGGTINGLPGDYFDKVDGVRVSTGATQSAGGRGCIGNYSIGENGTFGKGGNWGKTHCASGGGGGYFGGGGGGINKDSHCSGSSGSSYISGYEGCRSIKKDAQYDNPETDDNPIHYSNYYFRNGEMIDGNSQMPSFTETTQIRKSGPGAARITFLGLPLTCHNKSTFHYRFVVLLMIFIK